MKKRVPVPSSAQDGLVGSEWAQKYFGHQERSHPALLRWWYHLTAPQVPQSYVTFEKRELLRRGRLASLILLCVTFILLSVVLPIGLLSANHVMLWTIGIVVIVSIIAALFNRCGKPHVAGILIPIGLNLWLWSVIVMNPGGLNASTLSLFDLLVFSELFVASLLPVNWVLCPALMNIAFIVTVLTCMPCTGDLYTAMRTSAFAVILRPVALHVIVTVMLWLWVRSAIHATKRAERAEVIASFEHSIAEQEHVLAEEKRALDTSIQLIMQTYMQVANGDLNARVPLKEGAVLWPIAVSLNNLLYRLQRLRQIESEYQQIQPRLQRVSQVEYELQRTQEEAALLMQAVREARDRQRPVRSVRGGTLLDPLIQELRGHYIAPSPLSVQETSTV